MGKENCTVFYAGTWSVDIGLDTLRLPLGDRPLIVLLRYLLVFEAQGVLIAQLPSVLVVFRCSEWQFLCLDFRMFRSQDWRTDEM
jgi:hypothetical protein